jgi:hypothetical protein
MAVSLFGAMLAGRRCAVISGMRSCVTIESEVPGWHGDIGARGARCVCLPAACKARRGAVELPPLDAIVPIRAAQRPGAGIMRVARISHCRVVELPARGPRLPVSMTETPIGPITRVVNEARGRAAELASLSAVVLVGTTERRSALSVPRLAGIAVALSVAAALLVTLGSAVATRLYARRAVVVGFLGTGTLDARERGVPPFQFPRRLFSQNLQSAGLLVFVEFLLARVGLRAASQPAVTSAPQIIAARMSVDKRPAG